METSIKAEENSDGNRNYLSFVRAFSISRRKNAQPHACAEILVRASHTLSGLKA